MLFDKSALKSDLHKATLQNYEVFLGKRSLGFIESTDSINAIEMFKFFNPEWAKFRLRAELAW